MYLVDRINKYEKLYIKTIIIMFLIRLSIIVLFKDGLSFEVLKSYEITLIALLLGTNIIKIFLINKGIFVSKVNYLLFRITETIIFTAMMFVSPTWPLMALLLLIVVSTLSFGRKIGILLSLIFTISHLTSLYFNKGGWFNQSFSVISILSMENILMYFEYFLVSFLCGMINTENSITEKQNEGLLKELEEKYELLITTKDEVKYQFNQLKDTNNMLEETNLKLTNSVGEFFTLQKISQAISSIFNINDLLKYVNDIIIGVMGVSYSTILIYKENANSFQIHTTNIDNSAELITLEMNINSEFFIEIIKDGKPVLIDNVDEQVYTFSKSRNINSFICVPVVNKSKKYGLVLIEHKFTNIFTANNLRLIDVITQQVSIAMENAKLYEKLHELAITDELTQVYNRVYLQQRLTEELNNAKNNTYNLSICIFDIDFFKKFNDTYGHLFGDKVIKRIAQLVQNSIKGDNIIARFGGEEFIILFPNMCIEEAEIIVEELRRKISCMEIRDDLVSSSVTASFGIACYPESGRTEHELLKKADKALYEAKDSGRNCVKIA